MSKNVRFGLNAVRSFKVLKNERLFIRKANNLSVKICLVLKKYHQFLKSTQAPILPIIDFFCSI